MRGVTANGEEIRTLRKELALTQELLAAQSECDVKTVRASEQSKRIDVSTLRRIADALQVQCEALIKPASAEKQSANIKIAKQWVASFNARDAEAVANCFTENGCVLVFADPTMPGTGEFRGRDRLKEWANVCFATFQVEHIHSDQYRVDAIDQYVFMRVDQPKVKCQITGLESAVSVMWEFEIDDGKISCLTIYPDSAIERIYYPERMPGS